MGNVLRRSGSASPGSKASSTPREKDHESNVQFAREFVEELVENIPSEKEIVLPVKEDTTRYSVAFSDISAFSESSLPDLLQPEAQYKKQVDTDTDTTDYESAIESDALSLNASLGLDHSDPVSSPDVFDDSRDISTDLTPTVLKVEAENFEDAETSLGEAPRSSGLDISALCSDINRLCLETPKRLNESVSEGDSFLVTLNSDCYVNSTDTTVYLTETEAEEFVLGDSLIQRSANETPTESGPLSTTFDAVSAFDVSTEYNVEIIRTLDFEVEKPAVSNTEAEAETPPEESGLDLLAAEKPVAPEAEVTVEPTSEGLAVTLVDANLSALADTVGPTVKLETVDVASIIKAGESEPVDPLTDALELASAEAPIQTEIVQPFTEPESLETAVVEAGIGSAPEVASVEPKLSSSFVLSAETEAVLEASVVAECASAEDAQIEEHRTPLDETTETVLVAPSIQGTESEIVATPAIVETTESIPIIVKSEPAEDLQIVKEQFLTTEITETLVPSNEPNNVEDLSKSIPIIVKSEVKDSPQSAPEEIYIEPKLSTSFEAVLGSVPEETSVEPKLSTSFVLSAETKPVLEPGLVSEATQIVELQLSIAEIAESESILASDEPQNAGVFSIPESLSATSAVANFDTEPSAAPSLFASDEPELIAISYNPVENVSTSSITGRRKHSVSPSFLPIGKHSPELTVSPVPIVSAASPLPSLRQPVFECLEAVDTIDPVDAVWSHKADTTFCFSEQLQNRQHLLNTLSAPAEQEQSSTHFEALQLLADTTPAKTEETFEKGTIPFVSAFLRNTNGPSGDPFSPIPVHSVSRQAPEGGVLSRNIEGGDPIYLPTKIDKGSKSVDDRSLSELRAICQRQQRELDNQRFNSDLFGESLYNSIQVDSIAAEAAKVSEDIHNASIEQIESEMDENVNPVPLDKKWLSERSGGAEKVDTSPRQRMILAGGDGFADCLDKQNKNIMSGSIDSQTNQSEAGPEIALHDDAETFVDSDGFDFLSSKISTGPSDRLVRESLYTKFDPLATPVVPAPAPTPAPTSRHAPLPMPPKFSESTNSPPSSVGQLVQAAPPPSPPRSSTPSAHEGPTELTPPRNSAARALVDRLISLSPAGRNVQASPVKPPPPVAKPPQGPTVEEMSEELVLLRELLGEEEMAYKVSLAAMMDKLKTSELELLSTKLKVKSGEEREQKLMARLGERVAAQKQLAAVMCEYEKTISKLVGEKDIERAAFAKEREALIKEKNVALGHLTNIEIAFSDVHQKYERCKTVVEAFKSNEDVLRESLAKFEAIIHKQEQKYDMLKAHAMSQLENANQELDTVRRNQATESAKLKAMLKKSELKTSSLEEMLDQKVKENLELASICDDLIAKVGT